MQCAEQREDCQVAVESDGSWGKHNAYHAMWAGKLDPDVLEQPRPQAEDAEGIGHESLRDV